MLAALFATEIGPEFLAGIYTETEGNPFFVEEVCKALVESGQVYSADGSWNRRDMEELEIPQSVRVAIQSRVGKMPPACQDMLRLAAVLGREFEFDTLFAASEAGEEGLIDALDCAGRAQLIQEVSAERDVTFAFTHALIPATLSEGTSTLRRRRLHRRAAAAIEQLHPDDFEALAYHYGEAADEERALAYYIQAGERASAAYANVEAEGHYRAALELAERETERADLLGELGRAVVRQSRYDEAITVWQAGITQYQALGKLDGVARLYARAARAASVQGDWPRGLVLCREGMAAVADAPEGQDLADLLHETARVCLFNGLPDEASLLCHQALEMAERLGATRVQAEALSTLSALPGEPHEEALSALTRALELAESEGLLPQAYRAHQNLGGGLDDAQAAREHLLRALELARQMGDLGWELYSACRAAFRSLQLGELAAVEEALPSLHQLQDQAGKTAATARTLRGLEVTLLRYRGELVGAIDGLQSLRREARAAGDLRELRLLNLELAMASIWQEAGEEEELEAMLQETGDLLKWAMWPVVLAGCLLSVQRARQGEPEAARHLLTKAREQGAEHDSMMGEAYLSWAEAHLAMAEGHWPEALAAFETAIDTLGRAKLRWYRARTLVDWAEAYLVRGESGDRQRAQKLLSEAGAEFEAMGAPIYAEQVKGRLEQLGGRIAVA
jgi:tetratricopeptide (TPR) repeat protein